MFTKINYTASLTTDAKKLYSQNSAFKLIKTKTLSGFSADITAVTDELVGIDTELSAIPARLIEKNADKIAVLTAQQERLYEKVETMRLVRGSVSESFNFEDFKPLVLLVLKKDETIDFGKLDSVMNGYINGLYSTFKLFNQTGKLSKTSVSEKFVEETNPKTGLKETVIKSEFKPESELMPVS